MKPSQYIERFNISSLSLKQIILMHQKIATLNLAPTVERNRSNKEEVQRGRRGRKRRTKRKEKETRKEKDNEEEGIRGQSGRKNLEIGVSTKLIVTARIRGNVLLENTSLHI